MEVKTFHASSIQEFLQKLSDSFSEGFTPNTAIVFVSIEQDLETITTHLREQGLAVFGSSSCGEFLYNHDEQVITEGGIICTLIGLKPGTFAIRLFPRKELTSFEAGSIAGAWALSEFPRPALLVMASGLDTDGEQLVYGIQKSAGKDVIMYGGLAGDDARFQQTFVFTENVIAPCGVVVLVLDTDVYEVSGLATSGWVGIGADKTITKADGNIVYTIDGEPALDVYTSYLNVREDELPEIGVDYPLLVKKKDSTEVLRAVINVDREQRALIFAGSVPNGASVTFSSSPGFQIIESTQQRVNEFFFRNQETDLLILFSCMARHNALGPTISEEIDHAWQNWKKPLAGFFTYGEIGSNYNSACDFHNETFTMVSIKEK